MTTIRELREKAGLTQNELAGKALVSYASISRAENGKGISKTSLLLICRALGVSEGEVTGVNIISSVRVAKK